MKVQYVSICPTQQAIDAGSYAFTPELLASVGARYSRNNEGLDEIASKIDPNNLDKSVDSIFKMIDYGHASIADMTPIPIFIDGISLYAAYYIWTLSPTAGGQECSTRYIKVNADDTIDASVLGCNKTELDKYNQLAFNNYQIALEAWTEISKQNPSLTKIPQHLLDSTSEKDKKVVERMRRNYAFDRARVFLPLSASTGVMMVQSARAWAYICSHLQSHFLPELQALGVEIAEQMALGAPRLLKHTKSTESLTNYINSEFELLQYLDQSDFLESNPQDDYGYVETKTFLDIDDLMYDDELIANACKHRINRYSPFGNVICRTRTMFAWAGITFGEIRDLNRHRTGTKYCPLYPIGFYSALDELPENDNELTEAIKSLAMSFKHTTKNVHRMIQDENKSYIYFTSLGHQYYFEHTTTADKFLYEMELRTGVGAHYKYAEHCREALKLWYNKNPATKGLLFEGTAEPE